MQFVIDCVFNNSFNMILTYETPRTEVLELETEGFVCQSGQFQEWEEETIPW